MPRAVHQAPEPRHGGRRRPLSVPREIGWTNARPIRDARRSHPHTSPLISDRPAPDPVPTPAATPFAGTIGVPGGSERPRASAAIGFVLYRPSARNLDTISRVVATSAADAAGEGGRLYLFDNGGVPADALAALGEAAHVEILCAGANVGIATALNALCAAAARGGHRRLLVFDQDSEGIGETRARLEAAMDRLAGQGAPAAVVGPAPDRGSATRKVPAYPVHQANSRVMDANSPEIEANSPDLVRVRFLATSGSLIDLAAFAAVGPFRDDYFIDAVDLEWCFRAGSLGFSCWMDRSTTIAHHVGDGVIASRALGIEMPRQSPLRMATYLRNSVYGWRLPHIPLGWKLRQAAYLPLQAALYWRAHGYDRAVLRCLGRAAMDGLAGRLGPPRA